MREGAVGNAADLEEETDLEGGGGGGETQILLPSIRRKKKRATTEQIAAAKVELHQCEEGVSPYPEEEGGRMVLPTSAPSRSATRRVAPYTSEGSPLERALPNGDLYSGGFSGGAPHGSGKYLWADGCMYEGEWRRGKAAGKGKFSWPSGATYEGEFRSGRMEGFGTFTGADGDTYRGLWVADRKQGFGQKRYANGDYYEGEWRRNRQEGQGRYVWRNGNQYVGEWRNGVISGRGVLIWSNGNRFDGLWDNGIPRGGGVFTWPDGSCYVVNSWTSTKPNKVDGEEEDRDSIKGTFYPHVSVAGRASRSSFSPPSFTIAESGDHLYVLPSRKRSSVDGARGSCYADKIFPRICIWESDGEAGDITCDIIDTVEASMLYRNAIDGFEMDSALTVEAPTPAAAAPPQQRRSPWCFVGTPSEPKKPGLTISKGHKNYVLMRNLQLGISYSVGKYASAMELRDLREGDFDPREKFWTRFPPEGSKITPPHQSSEFRWKDYCPMVFRHLRKLFQVDPADYMLAICGNEALRELSSPGKSGSFFYLTQDDRFMIKTVKKSEVKVLIRMLSSYYTHVSKYSSTLLTKFFGVHCVKPIGGQKVRFVVMGNLFCSEYRIHRRFDLKGSSHGRTAEKSEMEIDETTTLKDLDLNFVFRLQKSWFYDHLRQIEHDCEFLEAEGIMDYSLLIGLHFCDDALASRMGLFSTLASPEGLSSSHSLIAQGGVCGMMDGLLNGSGRKPVIRLGRNMPARAELVSRCSESDVFLPGGEIYEVVLYFGIIDILQDYDISKKLEHAYKSLQVDPASISAVDPKLYSRRFRDFIHRIFVEDR